MTPSVPPILKTLLPFKEEMGGGVHGTANPQPHEPLQSCPGIYSRNFFSLPASWDTLCAPPILLLHTKEYKSSPIENFCQWPLSSDTHIQESSSIFIKLHMILLPHTTENKSSPIEISPEAQTQDSSSIIIKLHRILSIIHQDCRPLITSTYPHPNAEANGKCISGLMDPILLNNKTLPTKAPPPVAQGYPLTNLMFGALTTPLRAPLDTSLTLPQLKERLTIPNKIIFADDILTL